MFWHIHFRAVHILFRAVHIHQSKPQRLFRISLTFAVPLSLFFNGREHAVVEFLLRGSFFPKHILSRLFIILLSLLGLSVSFIVAIAQFQLQHLVYALFCHLFCRIWGFVRGLAKSLVLGFLLLFWFLLLFVMRFLDWSLGVASVEDFGLLFGLVVLELSQFFINFVLQLFEAFCAISTCKRVLTALVEFVSLLVLVPRMDNRRFIFV